MRNCYCKLWQTSPATLSEQGIPPGYCGFCEVCGKPGHLRHAPGIAPYTDAWCDSCFKQIWLRNNLQALSLLAIPFALMFRYWLLTVIAVITFGITRIS